MAEAVFADPELRAHFELVAKETAGRLPVPDDFSWLDPKADPRMDRQRPGQGDASATG
jgi:hypothetical protein